MKLGMTPPTTSVEEFGQLLVRSRLLDPQDVKTLLRRWRRDSFSEANDLDHFTQWLVRQEKVTEYQVQLLLRGHVDHCFLDDYKLLERVGKGRMAGVYKAIHKNGQIVALKVLPPSRAANPQALARFQREAKLALRLNHPNVVHTFQLASSGEVEYIVMEYLEGETLQDVLHRRGKLPAGEGVRLIYQALLGLQHLHEKRLVHRDLKPSNLMLVPADGSEHGDHTLHCTVKILDIGLGKDLLDDSGDEVAVPVQLTGENVLLGTPDYLAPEQARNARSVDIRADIYSLGCVLYHMLTGKTPFTENNIFQLILRHATDEPQPLRELEPSIPNGLDRVLGKMIAKPPEIRYETPVQAAEALRPYLPAPEALAQSETKSDRSPKRMVEHAHDIGRRHRTSPASHRAQAVRPDSDFEIATASQHKSAAHVPPETPAASVATKIVELSAAERALLEPVSPWRRRRFSRRDYVLLGGGAFGGALLVLALEAIAWFFLRGAN